jgi:hypothetical protein
MNTVFLLQHSYEVEEFDIIKTIGIYSSKEKSKETIKGYMQPPGFKDYPRECFNIDEYEIDSDNWQEGFFKWDDDDYQCNE